MSKMFLEGQVPEGETTENMVLAYNRTNTPKQATTNGHVIGAKEKAWITWDDPVLMNGIKEEIFRVVKNRYAKSDRVVVEQVTEVPLPPEPKQVEVVKEIEPKVVVNTQPQVAPKKRKSKNKPSA